MQRVRTVSTQLCPASTSGLAARPAGSPEAVLQRLVQTLCEIDLEYQTELAILEGYPEITELFAERLKARHRERRAPYIKALAQLHRAKNER